MMSARPAADLSPAASASGEATSVWRRPETVYLLLALVLGWGMALLTPPLQVPDEPAHLYRVWQLSHGVLVAPNYMVTVPSAFARLQTSCGAVTHNPVASIPVRDMFKGLRDPPRDAVTWTTDIDNTALYSAVPYLPQVVGVAVARWANGSALEVLYAGRLMAVVGYAVVGWWAIRVTPALKWPMAVALCSPMGLFMAASVSADPMTTAFAALAVAYGLRAILAGGPMGRGTAVGLGVSLLALTLCKSAYFPIVALLAAVPWRNWNGRRRWVEPTVIVALVLTALLGWSALSHPLGVREAGGDPAAQFHYVLYHPGSFLDNIGRTLQRDDYHLYLTGVGCMGWLDTQMPVSFVNIYTAAVIWLVLAYDEPVRVPVLARAAAAAGICGSVALVVFGNYLVWTSTAAPITEGLQGRYFLPLVPLLFLIIRRRGVYRPSPLWLAIGMAGCIILAYWCLLDRFYMI